ncbi:hypothetical protein JCM1840_006273 [Sporobolomyces johnsonii]
MPPRRVAKIAVVYYSTYGHVLSLTETIAAAARETGAEVDIYRFPEILSDDVRAKLHAAPHANYPEITPDDLLKYDGFLFGGATRYGRMPAAVSSFFDMTGGLWAQGKLVGKMAGIYTSSASQHGGQETTALTTLPFFAHHGIIYVPIGFASSELTDLSEIVGGSAWGAAAIAGGDGSRAVSDKEAAVAKYQGSSFAKTVAQFVAGKAAKKETSQMTDAAFACRGNRLEAKAAGASTTEEGAPVLAKAIPASAAEPTTTADADAAGYEVSDKAPAPVAKEEATPAPSAAAATPAESTPAPKEEAETAAPAPTPAPAPKKKSGGLFFCCGKKEHYDS